MIGEIIGGLTAAGNIVSLLHTNNQNVAMQRDVNGQNVDLQREINQQNIDNSWKFLKYQNEWQTPSNQMERFRQAGLNPNSMFGNMQSSASASAPSLLNTHQEAASRVAPQVDPLTAAQIANINADTEKKLSETKESDSRVKVNMNSIDIAGKTFELSKSLTEAQISQIQQTILDSANNINNLQKQLEILNEQQKQEVIHTAILNATKDSQIRKIISDANLTEQQVENLYQHYLLYPEQLAASTVLMSAQTNNLSADTISKTFSNEIKEKTKDKEAATTLLQLQHEYNNAKIDNALDNDVTGFSSYVLRFLGRVTENIKIIHR